MRGCKSRLPEHIADKPGCVGATSVNSHLSTRLMVAVLVALGLLAVTLGAMNLDGPSGFDEGIDASALLLMRNGLLPNRDFFHAQGPLFLFLVMPAFIFGGETLTLPARAWHWHSLRPRHGPIRIGMAQPIGRESG